MRIGVLGGTFDPPHLGHLAVADYAQQQLGLDLILFVPARPWQKQEHASADVRGHMTALSLSAHSDWQVSYVDLERSGPTYTVDTLRDLKLQWPDAEIWFIVGVDAANGLDTWRSADELKTSAHFAIVTRPRHNVSVPSGFSFQLVEGTPPDVSSTAIRESVAAGITEQELQLAVTPEVARFITETGLYR